MNYVHYFSSSRCLISATNSVLRFNTLANDIALVKLAEPTQFTEYIRPVCLPDPTVDVTSKTYRLNGLASCYILGWGEVKLNVCVFTMNYYHSINSVINSNSPRSMVLSIKGPVALNSCSRH